MLACRPPGAFVEVPHQMVGHLFFFDVNGYIDLAKPSQSRQ
jgi:hypothetical protein